jgi:uncharacterized protein YgbK (DUF1537 family)
MDEKRLLEIESRKRRAVIGSLEEYSQFIENATEDVADLISALREARTVVVEADAQYNVDLKPQSYEAAAAGIVRMCSMGREALDKWQEES